MLSYQCTEAAGNKLTEKFDDSVRGNSFKRKPASLVIRQMNQSEHFVEILNLRGVRMIRCYLYLLLFVGGESYKNILPNLYIQINRNTIKMYKIPASRCTLQFFFCSTSSVTHTSYLKSIQYGKWQCNKIVQTLA